MDENILTELEAHFLEHLVVLNSKQKHLTRIEQDVERLGVAASMAATSSKPGKPAIIAVDSGRWYRAVELTDDAILCHRPGSIGAEYAILEGMPGGDVYQTSYTSWNSLEVLQNFILERKELLAMADRAFQSQIKGFLRATHPQGNASLLADEFRGRTPARPLPPVVPSALPEASQTVNALREVETQ